MPLLAFCICAIATMVAVREMRRVESIDAQTAFSNLSWRLVRDFDTRLAGYAQLAQSASGLLNTGVRLAPAEWVSFVQGLPGTRDGAGFQGLGLAFRQPSDRADSPGRFPLGSLVPLTDANERLIGFDLAAEAERRAAIELARDRGDASYSSPLRLITGGEDVHPGLLVISPFYRQGRSDSISRRRENFAGVVVVGVRTDRLLQTLLVSDSELVTLRLTDVATGHLLFDSMPAANDVATRFEVSHTLASGGRVWQLTFASTPKLVARIDRRQSFLIGLTGTIATLLLTGVVFYLLARRQRADQRNLENYREFLLRILDTLPEPIVVKAADQRILIANRAYAEWVGMPAGDIVGHTAHDFFSRSVADESVALDYRILADGQPRQTELVIPDRRRQGEARNVIVRKMLGRGVHGESLVVGIHQDVTEVRRSEARFRQLTELSSDWYWEQDAEFRFTMLSGKGLKGNLVADDVVGKFRWDFPLDWSEAQWAEHKALLASHQPFHDLEYRLLIEDGARWFSISGEPIFDAEGRFSGYRGIGRNITARREVEAELRRHRDHLAELVEERTADLLAAKNAAEQASHVKSEFLANMSHELRTPLHAILSFARLGKDRIGGRVPDEDSTARAKRYFTRILEAGDRLLALVNDLLDLSKLEAGKMHYELKPCDLIQLVHGAAFEFEALIEERQLRLELPPPERQAPAMIDAPRFAQVLRNVLSNAFKFSDKGGLVRLRVEEAEMNGGRRANDPVTSIPAWRIEVSDNGVGIPEDEVEAVFDKFIQSSKTRTGAGGTGLGLAICREIVAAHRGSIAARNRPEGGAVFEILLPR